MTTSSSFHIHRFGSILYIRLQGMWSTQLDLAYLSELAEIIRGMRGQTWSMVVDMRGWVVPEPAKDPKYNIDLDRRNQRAECWLVDYIDAQAHLLVHFANKTLQPQRFTDLNSLEAWLDTLQIRLPAEIRDDIKLHTQAKPEI
jgi:hypothetical protein